ncbi:hypothetical protein LSAT2_020577, partial [Lamellibrachia satsuma]
AGRTAQPTPVALDYAILKTQNVALRAQRKSTFHTWVDVPDTACKKKTYGDVSVLPSASVVSSFHTHEDLLEILHTLHSLVQRSPARLLREIVIVDDHSVNGKVLSRLLSVTVIFDGNCVNGKILLRFL